MDPRVGRCLLHLRLSERKMTQTELANRTGISREMITQYANNYKTMSLINSKLIADILNCQIEKLYTWDTDHSI